MLITVVGTIIGVLVAGVLAKLIPEHDITIVQAAVVAVGCLIGFVMDGTDRKRDP